MSAIKILFAYFFLFAIVCGAADDTAKFKYIEKNGISVGTVLQYVKTNIDGTKPEFVSQYISAADVMESFKFHPKSPPAGFVVAQMDWGTFSAKSLNSWRLQSLNERTLFGTILFDGASRRAEVFIPAIRSEADFFNFKHLPVHLYNFDLGTLNFAFPHLIDPKKSFVIGIADPTFRTDGLLVEYKGEVTVSFAGEEKRNKVAVRKYKIDGPGLQNRGGFIWVNKKQGWIEDMEIALPDNPDWTSFKFKLLRTEKLNRDAWERFIVDQL